MDLHFISGLPRSGSTLLAAILKQNPRFHAGMSSPVSVAFQGLENSTSGAVETSVFISEEDRKALLKGVFNFHQKHQKGVVFDTSRFWCSRLPLLAELFPDAKMIICVREVGWILDSFEKLYRKNNMRPSAIYGWATGGTVYSRTVALAKSGVVGFSLDAAREAYAAPEADGRLMLVEYDGLCQEPEAMLRQVYDFIGEKWFAHNFSAVEYEAGEFDRQLGAEGLHTVRNVVEWKPRESILPKDLFDSYNGPNFWREK